MTKKANYETLLAIVDAMESNGFTLNSDEITYASLREFITHEIELLDGKTDAARKRAAAKKEAGDALREQVYSVLSGETPMTINEIVKALNDEDISAQMVTARLTQLVNLGMAEKSTATVKGKKLSSYIKIA